MILVSNEGSDTNKYKMGEMVVPPSLYIPIFIWYQYITETNIMEMINEFIGDGDTTQYFILSLMLFYTINILQFPLKRGLENIKSTNILIWRGVDFSHFLIILHDKINDDIIGSGYIKIVVIYIEEYNSDKHVLNDMIIEEMENYIEDILCEWFNIDPIIFKNGIENGSLLKSYLEKWYSGIKKRKKTSMIHTTYVIFIVNVIHCNEYIIKYCNKKYYINKSIRNEVPRFPSNISIFFYDMNEMSICNVNKNSVFEKKTF